MSTVCERHWGPAGAALDARVDPTSYRQVIDATRGV